MKKITDYNKKILLQPLMFAACFVITHVNLLLCVYDSSLWMLLCGCKITEQAMPVHVAISFDTTIPCHFEIISLGFLGVIAAVLQVA